MVHMCIYIYIYTCRDESMTEYDIYIIPVGYITNHRFILIIWNYCKRKEYWQHRRQVYISILPTLDTDSLDVLF